MCRFWVIILQKPPFWEKVNPKIWHSRCQLNPKK
jgi:hypothetical protein